MKDKIYKYGFLSVCGAVFILTLYFAAYGAVDRAYAFSTWMTGLSDAKVISYCNEGDNMMTKQICTGATVGID